MTTAPSEIADTAVTPTALLAAVRETRAAADRAEATLMELAVEWCHAHPASPTDESWQAPWASAAGDGGPNPDDLETECSEEELEWFGIPPVAWDAPAAFAAASAMSTGAGKAFLRDALILRHRLPQVWARVLAGQVQTWRARRIAQAVLGSPRDVVEHIDATLVDIAHKVGPVTLDRILDEAMMLLYPEQRETDQLEALDARHATLDHSTLNYTGIVDMHLRGDWSDLTDFDQALSDVAAALVPVLARDGVTESLDVRRSIAIGVLADPRRAHALLTGSDAPRPRRELVLYVHLSEAALTGHDVLAHHETGRPLLAQQVAAWAGRPDTHVTVKSVIDLNTHHPRHDEHEPLGPYAVPDRLKERVGLLHTTCVFPWCTKPARCCDCDHITPHNKGGPTCECNLAPLCRHHHRLKTHASWSYTPIEPGVYLWSSPHRMQFLRDREGTLDVTRPPP